MAGFGSTATNVSGSTGGVRPGGMRTGGGLGAPRIGGSGPVAGPAASGDVSTALTGILGGGAPPVVNGFTQYTPGQQPGAPGAPAAPAPPLYPGGGGGGGSVIPKPTTNTAEANPISNDIITTLQNRAKGDLGAPENLDRGIQKIRDNASMGIAGEQQMSRIRRGVSGSGIDKVDADRLAKSQQNDINALTKDIVLGRERDRDSLLKDTAGLGLSQGAQQIQAQQRADAQYNASVDAALREKAINTQNQVASFQALMNILS